MKVTYAAAIGDALKEEMRRDGKVLIYGEDIAQFGNIFGITRGMLAGPQHPHYGNGHHRQRHRRGGDRPAALRGADVFRLHHGSLL